MEKITPADVRAAMEKLLEEVKEAHNKLARPRNESQQAIQLSLAAIKKAATVGREKARLAECQGTFEGCFMGVLIDLEKAERRSQEEGREELRDLLETQEKLIEQTLLSERKC